MEANVPKTNLTDGGDELLCGPQKQDNDCVITRDTQDDKASSMILGSAGVVDDSPMMSDPVPTLSSNGQESKRPSSPSPPPVKTTCDAALSPNPKLNCCHSNSPRMSVGTSSDVEMKSPDSPVDKMVVINNSADKDGDGSASAEDSSSAMSQGVEGQQIVQASDSESLAKEKGHLVSTEPEDAVMAECSGSSDMSQDLSTSKSGETFERYL